MHKMLPLMIAVVFAAGSAHAQRLTPGVYKKPDPSNQARRPDARDEGAGKKEDSRESKRARERAGKSGK